MEVIRAHHIFEERDGSLEQFMQTQTQTNHNDLLSSHKAYNGANLSDKLVESITSGLAKEAENISRKLLKEQDGLAIIEKILLPILDDLGRSYNEGMIFLPQLLQAAQAAQAALDLIRESLSAHEASEPHSIILATVEGDIHDIGKNIAKTILENYGYRVIDLGRDVAPEKIAERVVEEDCQLLGLSALMTNTLPAMAKTIMLVKAKKPDCKIMLGGAVLTEEYAFSIGADYYCPDANSDIQWAREVFGA